MTPTLIEAVEKVVEGNPAQYPALSRIDALRDALTAHRAEIVERREKFMPPHIWVLMHGSDIGSDLTIKQALRAHFGYDPSTGKDLLT